jgi:hypothetical protein
LVQVPRGGIAYTSFYQFFFHDCSKSHPCQAKKSLLSVCFSGKSSLLSILPRPTDQRDQPLHEGFEEPEVQIDLPQFRKVNSGLRSDQLQALQYVSPTTVTTEACVFFNIQYAIA